MTYAILNRDCKVAWWYICESTTQALELAERDGFENCSARDLIRAEAKLRAFGVTRPWDRALEAAKEAVKEAAEQPLEDDDIHWLLTRPVEDLAVGVSRRGVSPEVIDTFTRVLFQALAEFCG